LVSSAGGKNRFSLFNEKIFSILKNVDEPCYNTTLNYTQKDGGFYLENECFIEKQSDAAFHKN